MSTISPAGWPLGASMPGFVSNLHGPDERVHVGDLLTAAKSTPRSSWRSAPDGREGDRMRENWDLFLTFARISASCFGGGYAMLPFFQRELVSKKGWLTDEELLDLNAVAQCTPGSHRREHRHFLRVPGPRSVGISPGQPLACWCPP